MKQERPFRNTIARFTDAMTTPHRTGPLRLSVPRTTTLTALAVLTSSVLAGCAAAPASDSEGSAELTTVTFALNYLPDPSLSGLAYAIEEGLFAEQGIEVEIIPFGSSAPAESLVSSGEANLGLSSDQRTALIAMAAGADLVSYFATYHHVPYSLTVLDESPYQRPADLAGTVFGTFGSPMESAVVNDMIVADGGSEPVDPVILSTGIYDALASARIESTLSYPGDAFGIEQSGGKVRTWSTLDYGLPDVLGGLVVSSRAFSEENPEIVAGFIEAMQAGYEAALEDPAAADSALVSLFPDELSPELVDYVSPIQTDSLYPSASGIVGDQSAESWQENAEWLIEKGLLTGPDGETLSAFDTADLFSTEYLD
jgi:ABC-type nitrate/sulfonate/bicarbonate transport system substrate-binding protein